MDYQASPLAGVSTSRSLVSLLVLMGIAILYIFLIQIIWNHVLVEKFPKADVQKLTFWDSLAMSVFFSLLTGGSGFIKM